MLCHTMHNLSDSNEVLKQVIISVWALFITFINLLITGPDRSPLV